MRKAAPIKPRNTLARDLWQCRAFHARTGPDNKRKAQGRKAKHKHRLDQHA